MYSLAKICAPPARHKSQGKQHHEGTIDRSNVRTYDRRRCGRTHRFIVSMIIAFLFIVACLVVLLDFDRSDQSFLCRVAAADTPQFFPLIMFLLFFANQKWISHLLRESDSRNAVDHQSGSEERAPERKRGVRV